MGGGWQAVFRSNQGPLLYDSAVQKLLDEVGLSLLDAATSNKGEWHNMTRPEALAAQARAASGVSAQVAAKRPSAVTKGAASSTARAAGAGETGLKPTKPAIQISDADRKRKILITDKCTIIDHDGLQVQVEEMEGKRRRVPPGGSVPVHCSKVAVYIKLCPQKPRLRKRRPRSLASRKRTISVT